VIWKVLGVLGGETFLEKCDLRSGKRKGFLLEEKPKAEGRREWG
jgi:hypothetical protein